jgi:deoxyadenosine/deoxycytidine kinase
MSQIISIDGNIGSGKSSFLSYLREVSDRQNFIFVDEPVEQWLQIRDGETGLSIFEKFYQDQSKYSFSFQMMAFISRFSMLRKAIKENPDAIIITERCLYTDKYVFAKMLYDTKMLEDVNYQIYCKWFEEFSQEIPMSKIIYIKTEPQVCLERINKRNRTGENAIELDYLNLCSKYHEDMMVELREKNIEVIVLNGNVDIYTSPNIYQQWYTLSCEVKIDSY